MRLKDGGFGLVEEFCFVLGLEENLGNWQIGQNLCSLDFGKKENKERGGWLWECGAK